MKLKDVKSSTLPSFFSDYRRQESNYPHEGSALQVHGLRFRPTERIPFATRSRCYTHHFAKYVVDLLRGMALQDVSNHLYVCLPIHGNITREHLNQQ